MKNKVKAGVIMDFNEKELNLFKEANIKVENQNYTEEEKHQILNETLEYIMSKSKKDIPTIERKFSTILDK